VFHYRDDEQYVQKLWMFRRLIGSEQWRRGTFLDVGCGVGALADCVEPSHYLGVDLVREFVEEASVRHPGYRFMTGDVMQAGDWDQRIWDCAVLCGVLSSVPEPGRLLQAAMRLTGGRIVFDISVEGRFPKDFDGLNRWSFEALRSTVEREGWSIERVMDEGRSWVGVVIERGRFGVAK